MGKLTKNQKLAAEKIEAGKAYTLNEAAKLVKEITKTKFDASVDIDVRLGVDPPGFYPWLECAAACRESWVSR